MNDSTNILNLNNTQTELVFKGLNAAYRHEFEKAKLCFFALEKDDGLVAKFFLAMLTYLQCRWQAETRIEKDELFEALKNYCDKIIQECAVVLDSHPTDQKALFLTGSAYGYIALYYLDEKNYQQSYQKGKEGVRLLKKLLRLNPAVYDAYLGIAIFEYYTYRLKTRYKFISLLDKIINIADEDSWKKYADLVVKNGQFAKDEMLLFLTTRYSILKQYKTGVCYAEALSSKYPEQMYIKYLLLIYYQQLGNVDLFAQEYDRVLTFCERTGHPECLRYIKYFTTLFAKLYIEKNMNDEAILFLNNYLDKHGPVNSDYRYLLELLAMAYESVNPNLAIETYQKILLVLPEKSLRIKKIQNRISYLTKEIQ